MIPPPIHPYEALRLEALSSLNILDTLPEERFDRITRLTQRLFHVPIALVSLVDSNRQWFKSCIGLDVNETSREVSFCGHAILSKDTFIIPDALADERFYDNPLVTGSPKIRFYAGQPLASPAGYNLGTLCLIDTHPRILEVEDIKYLKDLAKTVENELFNLELNWAARAISESEARFRKLAQNSPDYIFLFRIVSPEKSEILYFNRDDFFGYPPKEILNPAFRESKIHQADYQIVLDRQKDARQGKTGSAQYRIQSSSGQWEWVESRQAVFLTDENGSPTQLLVTYSHITQRKEAELALEDSESRYGVLIEALEEGIVLQNRDSRILASNSAAQKLLGLTKEQLEGRTSLDPRWRAIHEDGSPFPGHEHPIPQTLSTGEPQSNVIMGVHKPDDTLAWISISSQPLFHTTDKPDDAEKPVLPYAAVASFRDITSHKETADKLTLRAYYDSLTNLPNRRMFNDLLEYSLKHSQRSNETLAVGFVDLDRFKNVNDTLGHAVGDALLIEVGQRIKKCIRQSDTVARIGGDEFAIILANVGSPENCTLVAEKILEALNQEFEIEGQKILTSASIGLSFYPNDGEDSEILLKKADEAMYRAKNAGRSTYRFSLPYPGLSPFK